MLLRGRTALVTGGNSGIGKAIVQAFHREGARVAINFVADRDAAVRLADEVGGIAVEGDVSDERAVVEMVRTVVDQLGPIDILVNNAGFAESCSLVEMTAAQWDRMIAVHMRGAFLCSRYTVPQMLERRAGSIINIASQLGQVGSEGWVHYSAAKAGIIGFTKALSREVGPQGVRVNAIAPGPIETQLFDPSSDPEGSERYRLTLPLRRFGHPHEVAAAAVFLASDQSGYFTGQTLGPNGGDVML